MKKVQYQISINANAFKVWNTMWFHQTYKKWTNVFCEGSYYKGEIKEGNPIHFLTSDGRGMHSIIEKLEPNTYIKIKHLGELKDFQEHPFDDASWTGSLETYRLEEVDGVTTLTALNDVALEFEDWFATTFPKALQEIKNLCEQPVVITVETTINSNIETVWKLFNKPTAIIKWNNANDDWHTTTAINDFQVGGKFDYRMEAKDGSFGFNFIATYTEIIENKKLAYTMEDGRKCIVEFIEENNTVKIIETFDAELENSFDLQEMGWTAILNSFKKYVETN